MTTVCKQCQHFLNLEPGSARANVWYNHVCKASPLPTAVDPYDGKEKPFGMNDLGERYFADADEPAFQFCRNVNDGKCLKFVRKPNFQAQFS